MQNYRCSSLDGWRSKIISVAFVHRQRTLVTSTCNANRMKVFSGAGSGVGVIWCACGSGSSVSPGLVWVRVFDPDRPSNARLLSHHLLEYPLPHAHPPGT